MVDAHGWLVHVEEGLLQWIQEAVISLVAAAYRTAVTSQVAVRLNLGTGDLGTRQATQRVSKHCVDGAIHGALQLAATL